MSFPLVSRWPYLASVGLVAAATSDVLVEAIANTGAFGRTYFDADDSTIMPVLVAALFLAIAVIGLHVRAIYRRACERRDWLIDAARHVATHAPLRDLPSIAALQFGALFAMESFEQYASSGHLAGGLTWLGGPIVFSVCIHFSVGAACALAAGWSMRASLASLATLVSIALDCVLCALDPAAGASFVVRRDAAVRNYTGAARVRRISGRAPPFPLSPA